MCVFVLAAFVMVENPFSSLSHWSFEEPVRFDLCLFGHLSIDNSRRPAFSSGSSQTPG